MSLFVNKASRTVVLLLTLCLIACAMILSSSASAERVRSSRQAARDGEMGTPLAPSAVSAPHYTITDLGKLANIVNAQGYGLNNFGMAVGLQYVSPSFLPHGFRYKSGVLTDLDPVREAYAINNSGQVSGTASGRAVIYNNDGSITFIPQLPGDENGFGVAYGINDSGHAVGYSKRPIINHDPTDYRRAFLFRDGQTIDLNFGQFSTAYAINNSDQVVGVTGSESQALLWSNGTVTDLGNFGARGGEARAINNAGQIAGSMLGPTPNGSVFHHAFLWTAGFKQDLGVLPGVTYSSGYGINEYGQVVGDLNTTGGSAFIYTGGQLYDLNNLIPPNSGWVLQTAYDINDTGQIVGKGLFNDGSSSEIHAFLLTPTQAQPLVAGGKIVFSSNSEIWSVNDDGTARTQLTGNGRINSAPSWSPEGARVVFQSAAASGQPADIFLMSADGHDVKNLTNSAADDQQPVWSPDGSRIAFASNRDGDYDIYLMNADGSNLVNLTNNSVTDEAPAWSPDGTKLLFDSTLAGGETDIYVVNADGSNQKRLTTDAAADQFAAWSPDGKRVAFVSTRGGQGSQIWTMNADGSNQTRLTNNSTGNNFHPAYSPDGSRIAFISQGDNSGGELYTMNTDGSQLSRLTNDAATDLFPDWQKLNFPQSNVIDDPRVFVRTHYLDFLNREPDADGFTYWSAQVSQCLNNAACIRAQRIGVSAAFFIESEFQQTGFYVERLYRSGLARRASYTEFTLDRSKITVGPQLENSKQAFAEEFVGRTEFTGKYPTSQTRDAFVDALIANVKQASGVDLSSHRAELIAEYNAGANQTQSRARTLRKLIEYTEYIQAEYNPAFVLMQYFGYLKRDVDEGGYQFWLNILNNKVPNNYRSMVCAFITSAEYQKRFGSVVTHFNSECGG